MLTPLQYNALCDEIAVLYAGLENSIIEDMTRRILRMGFVSDSSAWQTRMLMESGMLYEDILAEIAQRTGQTDRQIRELFRNAGIQAVRNDNFYYRQAGLVVPRNMSDSALQVLNAGYQKCSGSLKNLTLTTANTSQQIFIQACNLAYMQTISGTMDYNTAVRHAVQSAAGNGAVVRYPSGHQDKLDVAVRRAVLTGVGQTVRQISFQNAKDFDCDLMEISAHAGARPSHAEWQGQIVSLSGRRGYLTLDAIGYGTADGFGGVNCRHDWFPFFEGFSERAYSEERLRELAEHKTTIDGVDYSDYELSQKQRYYERQIREKKRQVLAAQVQKDNAQTSADAAAADAEFQKKSVQLKQAEQKLKDFLHQTGFLNDSSRVWVGGFGRSQAQKAVWANRKYQQGKNSPVSKPSSSSSSLGGGVIKKIFGKIENNIDNPSKSAIMKLEQKMKRSSDKKTAQQDAQSVNPKYGKGKGYSVNCANCTVAYEFRRRGYDVIARPGTLTSVDDWKTMFKNFEALKPTARDRTDLAKNISETALKWGEGARGTVFLRWEKSQMGHFFSIEVENGKVLFIDPQSGSIDAEKFFKQAKRSSVIFGRLDNLEPSESALRACKNRR